MFVFFFICEIEVANLTITVERNDVSLILDAQESPVVATCIFLCVGLDN